MTNDTVYQRELERLFYRGHWCYVGLEVEIPNAGAFKRTNVGERSVILICDKEGGINVVENRCAHRGVAFLLLFYQGYAETLDSGARDDWPTFFAQECVYKVRPRENFGRGLRLALVLAPESAHGWLLKNRNCVFDSDLILNSMIYPI